MKNKIALLTLIFSLNCVSQTSKLDLENSYKAFNEININQTKTMLVDYLFNQYCILDEIESKSKTLLKSSSESQISELESIGYKFLENVEKFRTTYEDQPGILNDKEMNDFSKIYSDLRNNFTTYSRLLNNFKTDKDLFETLKLNNSRLRVSINEFIKKF